MAKAITVIPARINPITKLPTLSLQKRRTCGYARVSTDKDEQFTSYEAQVDYYTKYIKAKPEWEFVKVYTDEGISATNTKKRDGFKSMIEDALAGKIDLIVTKSVSRFARNTVDSLVTIRKLKEVGVEVFFEKENIWTLDSKGELLLTIMSSLAQEESRSISENVTWGKRKSASDGKISLGYSQFLGYDKGPNGGLVINEEQAIIVKRIYREFMQGKTTWAIAKDLKADNIPTPSGKNTNWRAGTIESILSNEKYKGAALLQKKYTVDYLSKKMKVNEGEVPQYYVEDSHEAIIPVDEWEMVQSEMLRRKHLGRRYSGNSIFSTRIICADCGNYYGSKIWHSTDERYRQVIWQCNDKFKNEVKCQTPHLSEELIKDKFVEAFNILFQGKKVLIQKYKAIAEKYSDCTEIENQLTQLRQELEVIAEMIQKCVQENASAPQDQDVYLEKYNGLVQKYEAVTDKVEKLETEKSLRTGRAESFERFIKMFSTLKSSLIEFDDDVWLQAIDVVKVKSDGHFIFVFHGGTEIEI